MECNVTLKTGYNKRRELYKTYLSDIDGVSFTFREIDVIACILHNRGEKKIASLLLISPRTVGTHMHNIMLKLGQSSRENIIDFIEKSGKLLLIRKYYLHLRIQSSFEKHLDKIAKIINRKGIIYTTHHADLSAIEKSNFDQLQAHLKLANINLAKEEAKEEVAYRLCVVNDSLVYSSQLGDLFLLFDSNININQLDNINYIDFRKAEDYYFSVLKLCRQIINSSNIDQIISDTKSDFHAISSSWEGSSGLYSSPSSLKSQSLSKLIILSTICFILLAWVINKLFDVLNTNPKQVIIDFDLPITQGNVLLRSEIIDEIEAKLSKKNGIQSVVLVGIGGSGKTTLARQYARKSSASIIWEIDTENQDTIISSLQRLAYAICRSSEEKHEINQIQKLQNINERERRLFLFLSKTIKNYPNWLIIYDKVKSFQDIVKYFPHDEIIWGNGKIIITTNNVNIAHSNYITDENIIYIKGLNDSEKIRLFTNITSKHADVPKALQLEYVNCLKNIPPFPLDVSIAAHYIKETQIPCNKYLQYNIVPQEKFLFAQKNILKDIGEYTKTRYDIITLSIERIIETLPDFRDLLFFISMIDFQNIPKDLLSTYKDEVTVDSFLHELKRFSLTAQNRVNSIPTFSIHRSTQDIMLAYFLHSSQSIKNSEQLQNIVSVLENYMTKELEHYDLKTIQLLIPHIETFLNRDSLFSEFDKANLHNKLGVCYFYLAKYAKAKALLEKTFYIYKKYYGKNHVNTAKTLVRLGVVHRNIGNYKKAKDMLEQAILIYKKYYGEEHVDMAWISIYLGSVYRHVGDYDKSIMLLKNGVRIYKDFYGQEHVKTARASAYLANVYKDVGNYSEARILLENTLKTYTKYYGENHTKTAWAAVRLASVYRSMGKAGNALAPLKTAVEIYNQYNAENCVENAWVLAHLGATYAKLGNPRKAVKILSQSLELYNEHIQNNNIIIGWIKYHLGDAYRTLKNYKKSQQFLEESLDIHTQYYGKHNIKTAQVLNSLGKTCYAKGNERKAENYINTALEIFTIKEHPDRYKVLPLLTKLHSTIQKP